MQIRAARWCSVSTRTVEVLVVLQDDPVLDGYGQLELFTD